MKKKVLTIFLILTMCLTMFPTAVFATGGGIAGLQGDGSPNNPYLISNKDELQKFRNAVNGGQNQICGKLTDDIGIVTFKDSLPSIGTANYPYMGTFDGNGYSISTNVYDSTANPGVFGCIGTSGTVQNLAIKANVGSQGGGGLAYSNAGTIVRCTVYSWDATTVSNAIDNALNDNKNDSLGGGDQYGGIVNTNTESGKIINCCVLGPMDVGLPGKTAGGIAYSNSGTIENCYFLGKIYESRNKNDLSSATAIVANNTGTVNNCYYLQYDDNTAVAGTALTKEQFESGEAACLLNNGRTGADAVWRQNLTGNDDGLDVDRGPMLDSAHGCVYRSGTAGNYSYYSLVPHKHGDKELTAWRSADSLPTDAAGTYYLTKDVTFTSAQEISADVSICLNGHTITGETAVQNGGKFTLTDCKEGSFDGKITVDNGGACTLNEGTFHVEVTNNGDFVTNDSTLTGKDTAVTNNGRFEMNGGSITGNRKGVINNSNINISGAANITGNTDSNLYLADGTTITFGELDERADIGITAEKQGELTGDERISISANGADNLDCVSADNAVSFEICVSGEGLALCSFKGHKHCICGLSADTKETVKGHDKHTEMTFDPWLASDSLPETSGAYYLTQNVTLNATWQPPADTVLCLNGKTITYNGKALAVTGGTVTITDCAKSWKAGTIDATAETASIAKDGTLILYRGKLAGKRGIDANGTFVMYGGTVTGSTNSGVRLDNDAAFTMNGGAITGNSASKYGAGVYVTSGTFTMNGGEITENSIADGNAYGGGVYVKHGAKFIMNDGIISRNTLGAKTCHGGGVSVVGIFEMNNGEIINNSTEGAGGGVFLRGWDNEPAGSSKFIMRGGRITGNTSNVLMGGKDYDTGAGVYVDSSGYFYLDKDPDTDIIITGNTKKSDGAARNVYLGPTKASGSPPGHTISIIAPLTGTIRMGVTTKEALKASGVAIAKTADEAYITGVKLYDIFTSDKDSGYFAARYTATAKDIALKKHSTHEYSSYEASGSTITEKCSECGQSGGTLTIAAPVAGSLVYDGTAKTATVTASDDWSGSPAANQVDVTYTKKGDSSFAGVPKEAGTYTAAITLDGVTASTGEYTITPKEVTVSGIQAKDKEFNGSTEAELDFTNVVITGKIDSDELTVTAAGAFDNADVGQNKSVGVSDLKLSGKDTGNYALASAGNQTAATAAITPAKITPVLSVSNSVYGTAPSPSVAENTGNGAVTYYYNTNDSNENGTAWSQAVKLHAGEYYMYAEIAENGNYAAAKTAAVKFKVEPKPVTVSGITAQEKKYDGNPSAGLDFSNLKINGKIEGDDLQATAAGTFENANAGENKTVNLSNMKLSGSSAANYVLAATGNQMTATANIMPKEVTITAAAVADKTYDGNANATVTEVTIAGVNGNLVKDTDFEVTAALFPDADVDAADVNVNITVALKGDAAKNYQLTNSPYVAASAAKIGKKAVTIKVDSKSKTEGSADPAFTGTATGLVQDTDLGTITYKRADADKDKEEVGADISIVAEYTENSNYDVTVTPAKLTIDKKQTSGGGGGGSFRPNQKPTIQGSEGAKTALSADGTKLTVTVEDGYEITDVLVNGVSKGAAAEITGLKTGDKVEVKTAKKTESTEPTNPTNPSADKKAKLVKGVQNTTIVLKSKLTKDGKVLLTWTKSKGYKVDRFEIYRSTKKNSAYGTKAFFTTKDGDRSKYLNTKNLKAGRTYYYKVRGVRIIDGQKYYTEYSSKAWRSVN